MTGEFEGLSEESNPERRLKQKRRQHGGWRRGLQALLGDPVATIAALIARRFDLEVLLLRGGAQKATNAMRLMPTSA